MLQFLKKRGLALLLALAMVFSLLPTTAFATTVNVLDGQVSITDSANNCTVSNGVVTIKVKGSIVSKKTNNVTIINETDGQTSLSFDYSASTYNSFTIAGVNEGASGTYSVVLAAGASLSLSLVSNSGLSNTTATLTLSNFSLKTAASESSVTVNFDSALGSVTAGGSAVTAGSSQTVSLAEGVVLAATAGSGSRFLGWINEVDNSILSTDASYKLIPAEDMTVKAIFVNASSKPHFMIGGATQRYIQTGFLSLTKQYYYTVDAGTHIFDDLNTAATAAASSAAAKAIVLLNDSTLPAGTYTIPSGVTLLIPFNSANHLYTTEPLPVDVPSDETNYPYTTPTAYRTLTMAEGAHIVVNGAMSASAKHTYTQGSRTNGNSPSGAASFVRMSSGSSITINNGGSLYAYGFITGSGSVTAKNGAKLYEYFQIMDFRGGTQSTDMQNRVFPISQYYIQNIEVPLTLEYGAIESCYATIRMSGANFGSNVAFIGPSKAMFNLTSGSVTKTYDGSRDRLIVELNGNLTVSPVELPVGSSSINSSEYVLGINGNMTVKANSGTINLSQDMAFLPGCELIIEKNANGILASGCEIIAYDSEQWANYCGAKNISFIPVGYAPGRTYNRTAADLTDAKLIIKGTVDASLGETYTTQSGAAVTGEEGATIKVVAGTQATTYQLIQGSAGGYVSIPITSAKLQNADGSFTNTAGINGLGTFVYTNGVWTCQHNLSSIVTAPTCDTAGYTTHTCSICYYSYKDTETDALGHDYTTTEVDPTCTEAGGILNTCTTCGYSYLSNEIAPLGHSYNSGDVTKEPTCTEDGIKTYICADCEEETTEPIPATGHLNTSVNTTDATCTEAGSVVVTCSCGAIVSSEPVAPLGHDEVTDAAVAATCTEAGKTEGKHCDRCGEVLIAQEDVPALGHDEVTDAAVAATCTEAGKTEGKHCDRCGEVLIAQEDVPALGHDEVTDAAVAATCTEAGKTEGKHCDRCGEVLIAQEDVPALGHDEVTDAAVAATCTEAGKTEGKHCDRCGEVLIAQEDVPALGHDEVIDAAVAATCTEAGKTEGKHCDRCGEVLIAQEDVPALGHDEVTDAAVAATCTEAGKTEGKHCDRCGEVLVAQEDVPATGHSHGTPADNGNGTHTAACACGDAITEDHNYVDGSCICGAVEVTEPTVDSKISIGETLSLESDLTMNLRIKTSQLTAYDLSTAYLVVERDVYNSDGTMEVETRTLTDYTIKDNRLVFAYTGISAAQMNDEIRAVLYIKDANGKEYKSNQKVTSVAIYSDLMLGASAGNQKLITLIMDMLNYGTAAQIYFNRHADAPVNEAFESFKTYASYASTDLKSALEDMSGTISNGNASAAITQGLDLSTRVGITYKVKLPAGVDAANASLIIKDADGNELETFDLSTGTVDSKGRYCVTFFGSTSREMRRVVYATVTVDGEAISDTYTYTISSYAHTIANTAGMPETLVNLTKLMVIYGDSADAYFA